MDITLLDNFKAIFKKLNCQLRQIATIHKNLREVKLCIGKSSDILDHG